MCDCSDFSAPAVFKEVTRRARKRHRCGECKGLITPGCHYWESRGLWEDQWSTHKTCGSCYVIAHTILPCYLFGDLMDCIDSDPDLGDRITGHNERIAYMGMLQRRAEAMRILRQEQADD
jgi:hypothetical protein